MLGILLTLIAVLLVICFAFYFSDNAPGRGVRADSLFFADRKSMKRNPGRKPDHYL